MGNLRGREMISTNGNKDLHFVDTNILVYAHDRSAGDKHLRARELVANLWATKQGCLSLQVLQEFYVTVTLKVAEPLPIDTAIQVLRDLSLWHVHRPTVDDLVEAAMLQQQYKLSYWDALIVQSAKRMDCKVIWSEDLNTGQRYQNIPIRSPF